jgi:hypothetical protein
MMKTLKLNAMGRLLLLRTIPQRGTLNQIAVYLRLKEEEQPAVGWQENPESGTVTNQDVASEFDVELEDADFAVLAQLAAQWDQWPTAQESLALKEKLGLR